MSHSRRVRLFACINTWTLYSSLTSEEQQFKYNILPAERELREDTEARGSNSTYPAPLYCPGCHIFLETRTEGMAHLGKPPHNISTEGEKAGRSLSDCEFCPKRINDRNSLKKHEIDLHMKASVQCKCGTRLSNDTAISKHQELTRFQMRLYAEWKWESVNIVTDASKVE